MTDNSKIEWTDATWNPVVGCSILSPACTNCYAMRTSHRLARMGGKTGAKYAGLTEVSKSGPVWNGTVRLDVNSLDQPLRWQRPRRIFVNSMSDLFHEELSDHDIDQVFDVMIRCPQHIFQVLTKRPQRMFDYMRGLHRRQSVSIAWPLANVWLGVTAEDQKRANERVPLLTEIPAAIRFVSCEPLLGPVDLTASLPFLDWIIAGGESGPKARPSNPTWFRDLRDQCAEYRTPLPALRMLARRISISSFSSSLRMALSKFRSRLL